MYLIHTNENAAKNLVTNHQQFIKWSNPKKVLVLPKRHILRIKLNGASYIDLADIDVLLRTYVHKINNNQSTITKYMNIDKFTTRTTQDTQIANVFVYCVHTWMLIRNMINTDIRFFFSLFFVLCLRKFHARTFI